MIKLLQEIGRRAVLQDLLEESKEADASFQTIDDTNERYKRNFNYLVRNASRATIRILIGDGSMLAGIVASSYDSDNLLKYMAMGSATLVGAYIWDYVLFDKLLPQNFKK